MSNNLLTDNVSEPLNGATAATVEVSSGTSNLTIDGLRIGEQVLATGTLQYFEKQGTPTRSVRSDQGRAVLTLRERDSARRPWFRFPWDACYGRTDWQIHLNPTVASDINAHTGGGNVKLDLTDMRISHVSADTGGGNLEVLLPDHAANLAVSARTGGGNVSVDIGDAMTGSNTVEATSGAGNVELHVPEDIPARVHAASGLGKVAVEERFSRIDHSTYQSPGYEDAINRVDITLKTGAGNVTVATKVTHKSVS
jgi:hypothetical protein